MATAEASICSATSRLAAEPLPGTAPLARAWLAIEQHGPFGHDALRQSHFPREIADQLLAAIADTAIRPALIRPVGRHADRHRHTTRRQVFLASSIPGREGLVSAAIEDARELLTIDFVALSRGDLATAWPRAVPHNRPLLLVCTHSKRDLCCAMYGRPLAAGLASNPNYAQAVWETSHLGGHRFAPTAVQLPHGWVHGRLDHSTAAAVLDGAMTSPETVPIGTARGRSALTGPAQAADLAVRGALHLMGIADTDVIEIDDQTFEVLTPGGRRTLVDVTSVDLDFPRLESCGGTPKIGRVFKTTIL